MQIRQILCPVDFSPPSRAALTLASSLARERQPTLHIVHVQPATQPGLIGELNLPLRQEHHALWKTVPSGAEVTFHRELLFGDAADEILRFATEHNVDLIVMGSHGRAGMSRLVMGSVTEAVMRQATAPVLSVRASACENDEGELPY